MTKLEKIIQNYESDITEVEVCSQEFGQFAANIIRITSQENGEPLFIVCDMNDDIFEVELFEVETI